MSFPTLNNNLPYRGYGSSNQCYSNSIVNQESILYVPDESSSWVLTSSPGDVTDNALVRWDGVTGQLVQNSDAILTDSGNLTLKNLTLTDLPVSVEEQVLVVDASGNVSTRDFPTDSLAIANVGAVPNSKGMTLSSGVLNLEPASVTYPGVVTASLQSFAGNKIFTEDVYINGDLVIPSATATSGVIRRQGDLRSILKAKDDNIFMGTDAGNTSLTGFRNVTAGLNAGELLTTGSDNTLIGQNAGNGITTGNDNLLLGSAAGSLYTSSETNNIMLLNEGQAGEDNQIKIGNNSHLKAYCEAIKNNALVGSSVIIDTTTGELGYGSAAASISFDPVGAVPNANGASVAGSVVTLQPASTSFPGVVTAAAQSFAGNKSFTGIVSTDLTFSLTAVSSSTTGYISKGGSAWIHGGDSDASQSIYVGVSSGTFSPSFRNTCMGFESLKLNSSVTQTNTAIGWKSLTALATGSGNLAIGSSSGLSLVTGDNNMYIGHNGNAVTTESNKIRIGNSSHNGITFFGVLPLGATGTNIMTFSDADASVSATQNLPLPNTASSSVGNITFNGTRVMHTYSSSGTKTNVFLGSNSGNYTNSGTNNVGLGVQTFLGLTSGVGNVAIGGLAGSAVTTGTSNTILGQNAGVALTTGVANTFVGSQAGQNITTTGGNIIIGNVGTVGDTNKIIIGNVNHTGGTSMYGISGATSSAGVAVLVNASGVLGTVTSSQRFKHDITDITAERANLLHSLRPVDFYYNDDPANLHKQEGLIAEEVLNVFPEFVVYDLDGNIQTIQYHQLWPILLKEVQVQRTLITNLQSSLHIMNQKWMILENKLNSGTSK